MPDFSKARVGDGVYSLMDGDGVIDRIDANTLLVRFGSHSGRTAWFHFDGFPYSRDLYKAPILYWSKPEISDPSPPKRTKKVKGWVPIWSGPSLQGRLPYSMGEYIWESESEVKNNNEYYKTIAPVEFEVEDNAS